MLKILQEGATLVALFASLVGAWLAPTAALADEIQLIALDRSNSIMGCLIEYEDDFYTLETVLGILLLSDDRFECRGEACPFSTEALADQRRAEIAVDLPAACSWVGF